MKPFFIFLNTIIILSFSLSSSANFGGYKRSISDTAGDFLNYKQNNSISLEKEELNFILGQRINFHGTFWFKNTSNKKEKLTLAFPQSSYWSAKHEFGRGYLPDTYYPLDAKVIINDKKTEFDEEKFSVKENLMSNIELLSGTEIKPKVIQYAEMHEAERPPSLPIIIWNLKEISFNPGEKIKIEIAFTRPWFYEDKYWDDGIKTDGTRYFNYITETATTWANGIVKEFIAQVSYPPDATEQIDFKPLEWEINNNGKAIMKKNNWSPDENENISFIWRSKYKMISSDLYPCDSYYKDYHWRFLFDGSSETAWCTNKKGKDCSRYGLKPLKIEVAQMNQTSHMQHQEDKDFVIKKIKITNGFSKNKKTYKYNSRPKKIMFYISNDKIDKNGKIKEDVNWKKVVKLKDTMEEQIFDLSMPVNIKDGLNFKILEVYEGKKYDDICTSEIDFE